MAFEPETGTLSSSSITVNVGESGQITFNGVLSSVVSADTSIATVKADGNYSGTITITGISAGNTTATVHWTGGSSSITITVINNEDTSFLNKRGLAYFWNKINTKKQNKLTAGSNIIINGNTISASQPTVNNATLTITQNGTSVGTFTANASSNKTINITVPTTAADVSALPASTKYGASITVSLNTTDYKMTTTLKDQDGNTLGTAQTIDLPLESVVVNGSYDNTNKKIVLTLQNGNTVDIPVGDLVAGLQTEITSTNKLSSDLVDDTNHTHKFVTAAQITKLNGVATGAEVNVQSDWSVTDTTSDAFIKNKPTIPTVNNGALTIKKNGTNVATFTANQSSNTTANIVVPTKTSDLTNDSGFLNSVAWSDVTGKPTFATVATTGAYSDLTGTPAIPTATSDLTNDSGFINEVSTITNARIDEIMGVS